MLLGRIHHDPIGLPDRITTVKLSKMEALLATGKVLKLFGPAEWQGQVSRTIRPLELGISESKAAKVSPPPVG